MKQHFEYCAAKYLDQWVRKEADLHTALQTPNGPAVRAALAYFKVSRGFLDIATPKVSESIAKLLVQYDRYVTKKTAPAKVAELAAAFGKQFDLYNLSAASKLFWLRRRSPFVVLDSRAVRALRRLKYKFDKRNYHEYYSAWFQAFNSFAAEIKPAVSRLPDFVDFTIAASLGKSYVQQLTKEDWFAERTFDQYLWLTGAPRTRSGNVGKT